MQRKVPGIVFLIVSLTVRIAAAGAFPDPAGIPEISQDALIVHDAPADVGMDAKALGKINERMREFVRMKQAAGIVTLVARKGKVVHLGAVGEADIASSRKMTRDGDDLDRRRQAAVG